MKKSIFALSLAALLAAPPAIRQLEAATAITESTSAQVIIVPAGFMTIGNEEIETIEMEAGTDNVLFKGKNGGRKSGKVVKDTPRGGRQGGHMTVTEDYHVAGLSGGNVVFFDATSSTLFITEVTENEINIVSQTVVTLN